MDAPGGVGHGSSARGPLAASAAICVERYARDAIVHGRRATQTTVRGCDALADGSPEARSRNDMRRCGAMVAQEFDAVVAAADMRRRGGIAN
eukprot:8949294-Pyramimonas_sp.AAC.1